MPIWITKELRDTGTTIIRVSHPVNKGRKRLVKIEKTDSSYHAEILKESNIKGVTSFKGIEADWYNVVRIAFDNMTDAIKHKEEEEGKEEQDYKLKVVTVPIYLDIHSCTGFFLYLNISRDKKFDTEKLGAVAFPQTIEAWIKGVSADDNDPTVEDYINYLERKLNCSILHQEKSELVEAPNYLSDDIMEQLQESYESRLLFGDQESADFILGSLENNMLCLNLEVANHSIIGASQELRDFRKHFGEEQYFINIYPFLLDGKKYQVETIFERSESYLITHIKDQLELIKQRYGVSDFEAWRTFVVSAGIAAWAKCKLYLSTAEFNSMLEYYKGQFLDLINYRQVAFNYDDFITDGEASLNTLMMEGLHCDYGACIEDILFPDREVKQTEHENTDSYFTLMLVLGDRHKPEEVAGAEIGVIKVYLIRENDSERWRARVGAVVVSNNSDGRQLDDLMYQNDLDIKTDRLDEGIQDLMNVIKKTKGLLESDLNQ